MVFKQPATPEEVQGAAAPGAALAMHLRSPNFEGRPLETGSYERQPGKPYGGVPVSANVWGAGMGDPRKPTTFGHSFAMLLRLDPVAYVSSCCCKRYPVLHDWPA